MDVVEQRRQIAGTAGAADIEALGFDQHRFVAVTEESAPLLVADVETSGVGMLRPRKRLKKSSGGGAGRKPHGRNGVPSVLQPAHAIDEIGFRSFENEVTAATRQRS